MIFQFQIIFKKEISLPIYYNLKKEFFKVIKVIEKICDKNLNNIIIIPAI